MIIRPGDSKIIRPTAPSEAGIPTNYGITDLDDPGSSWAVINDTDWAFSGLVATYSGSPTAVDVDSSGLDGVTFIHQTPISTNTNGFRDTMQALIEYAEGSADGMGVFVGFCDHPTNPTSFMVCVADRASSGNETIRFNGDVADSTTDASFSRTGKMLYHFLPQESDSGSHDMAMYGADGEIDDYAGKGGAPTGIGAGTLYLMFGFVSVDGNDGSIELEAVAKLQETFKRIGGI